MIDRLIQTVSEKPPFAALVLSAPTSPVARRRPARPPAPAPSSSQLANYGGPKANALGLFALTQYGGRTLQGPNITAVNGNMVFQ